MQTKYLLGGLALAFAVSSFNAHAGAYPDKPIRLLVGYSPAGAADTIGRFVADALSKELGQSIIVENRPGAGSTLASAELARAPADGYTLGLGTGTIYGMDQYLYKVSYTPSDLTPIMRLTISPLLLAVNKKLGVNSVDDLIAKVKANPDKLNYSSSGVGGSPHMAALIFQDAIGGHMVHVPYKGGSPALQAVAAGEVDLSFGTAPSVLPMAQADKVKVLAVSTLTTSEAAPGVPPLAEQGLPGFDFTFWFGLFGPAGLPADVQATLAKATQTVLNDPSLKEKLLVTGNIAAPMESSQAFENWAKQNGDFVLQRAKKANVKME